MPQLPPRVTPSPSPPRRLARVRRIVAVASGKGGVGKSTVAVNLALGLARQGYRVGLLDADVHGPNVPLMLGVQRRHDARGWAAIVPIATLADVAPEPRLPALERFGIRVMSIGLLVGEEQAALMDNVGLVGLLVRNLLTMVDWGDLDVLLVDFPPGTGEPQATLLATVALDGVALVVTPQDVALLDTSRALAAFRASGVPVLGLVENMSYLRCPHCGERLEVFHRGRVPRAVRDDVPLLAEIPIDPALSEAGDTGRPLLVVAPDSPPSRQFLSLARVVGERLDLATPGSAAADPIV
ncbi:MAG TPA: Mrp/NBP35 family ATP-binding protein [Thermomicrobiaceae bacterium]|nr:Mrp/NBP35 family ATP-binding protein [Thermomicrobiaceae bacterium]